MPTTRRFHQLDVFTATPLLGNPLAVMHDAHGIDEATMAAFARWTNLSESTFLLPPIDPRADYRVRIFTPGGELPFAGHPTLGSCAAWLDAGGVPRDANEVIQECGVGLVRVRRDGSRLAFAAPPLRRTGPLDTPLVERISRGLGINAAQVQQHQWVDNGPGWCAVMLPSAHVVRRLRPDMAQLEGLMLGVVGACAPDEDTAFEVRVFVPGHGVAEDPVTGSLNAGLAQWLIGAGLAPSQYVAAQGSALGRAGRIHVDSDGDTVWIGGDVVVCVRGEVTI